LIALAASIWISRLVELLISPLASLVVAAISFLIVFRAERRLARFAILVFAISAVSSVLQVWNSVDRQEQAVIENQLSLDGEFVVQSDSSPFGSGFRTWIEFSSEDFGPMLGSLIDESGHYRWGEKYAAQLSFEPNWGPSRGNFIASTIDSPVLIENPGFIQNQIGNIRGSFLDSVAGVTPDSTGLVAGLAVGERTLLSDQTSENMRRVALTHLVAVSGANCAIVLASVYFGLGLLKVRRKQRFVAALISLVLYVLVVGFDPSVLRAGFMAATVILAMWLGRGVAPIRALSLSMIILLSFDPWLAIDFAFALSVFSTLGILVLAPALYERLSSIPKPLAVGLAVSFSAQLYCIPVMLMLQPELPIFGVIANILAEPMVAPVTVLGITAVFLSPVLPWLSSALSFLASFGTWWIALVANRLGSIEQATLPWPNSLLGLALAALMAIAITASVLSSRYRTIAFAVVALLLGGSVLGFAERQIRVQQFASQRPEIVNCDVGQGDAMLIRSGKQTMLIDVGKDEQLLSRCLAENRVKRLDVLVLSHYDLDHVGGIEGLHGVEIGTVLVSGFNDQRRAVTQVADFLASRNLEPKTGYRGMSGNFGSGFWEVISPSASASEANNANDASLVILLTLSNTQLLALGDLGGDFQEMLIQQGLEGRLDSQLPLILKVSHHGSADQSDRFHRILDPEISIISVGENSYGHPDGRFISFLRSTGSMVLRTDQQRMVGIQTGSELRVFATGRL